MWFAPPQKCCTDAPPASRVAVSFGGAAFPTIIESAASRDDAPSRSNPRDRLVLCGRAVAWSMIGFVMLVAGCSSSVSTPSERPYLVYVQEEAEAATTARLETVRSPSDGLGWLRYAEVCAARGEAEQALAAARRALHCDGRLSRARLVAYTSLERLDRTDEAALEWKEFVRTWSGTFDFEAEVLSAACAQDWMLTLTLARRARVAEKGRVGEVTALSYELVALHSLGRAEDARSAAKLLRLQATVTLGLVPAFDPPVWEIVEQYTGVQDESVDPI